MRFDLPKLFESEVVSQFGPGIALSASIPFSASDGEKVAGGRMRCVRGRGERAGVKRRISIGFNGPIRAEGVDVGAAAEETTDKARANREFLEKALASV